VKECAQVSFFAVRNGPSRLSQNPTQCFVAFPTPVAFLLAGALVLAWDHTGPAATVSRIRKCLEIDTQFGEQVPSHHAVDAGYRG
jgi:hypothetical protein